MLTGDLVRPRLLQRGDQLLIDALPVENPMAAHRQRSDRPVGESTPDHPVTTGKARWSTTWAIAWITSSCAGWRKCWRMKGASPAADSHRPGSAAPAVIRARPDL